MKFILAITSGTWVNWFLLVISPSIGAQTFSTQSKALEESPYFLFDKPLLVIFIMVAISLIMGIFLHIAFVKVRHQSGNVQSLDIQAAAVQSFKSNYAHYWVGKHYECEPLRIMSEQISHFVGRCENVQFIHTAAKQHDVKINVCPTWFENAIAELLTNATHHNRNKANLVVTLNSCIHAKEFIVTLCDNGVGMPETMTNSFSRNISGFDKAFYTKLCSPLNLRNIGSILRRMNGTLEVTSARRYLTKITMRLPLPSSVTCEHLMNENTPFQYNLMPDVSGLSTTFSTVVDGNVEGLIDNNSETAMRIAECIAAYETFQGRFCTVDNRESSRFVVKFNQLLSTHYCDEHFNKAIATKMMLMTDKTLTRRLQKHYALGFVDILRTFRLRHATRLLLNDNNVTNVAFDTGFSSPSYFTRCFKKEFGFTPSLLAKRGLVGTQ